MEERTKKTVEEKHEKQELKDEELDLVAGGAGFSRARCSSCGSIKSTYDPKKGYRVCSGCGRRWR